MRLHEVKPNKSLPADMIPPEAKTTESIDEDAEAEHWDQLAMDNHKAFMAKRAGGEAPTDADADAEASTGGEAPTTTTGTIPADISMMDLSAMILDAGLIEIPSGKRLDPTLAKILPEEDTKENEMRVDEMCGCGGEEMEMPKTNYNLSVTKDEGSTHKTMTVTSDQPDELIRILQLSGMDTGHSVPDSIDMDHHDSSPDMDHHDSSPVSSMKDLVAKISGPSIDDGSDKDTHEDVEMDITSKPATFGLKDLVVGQTKKQPSQRTVTARQGDNPYKDAGQLEEEFTAEYEKFKNIE